MMILGWPSNRHRSAPHTNRTAKQGLSEGPGTSPQLVPFLVPWIGQGRRIGAYAPYSR